jgi:hypothetical protein
MQYSVEQLASIKHLYISFSVLQINYKNSTKPSVQIIWTTCNHGNQLFAEVEIKSTMNLSLAGFHEGMQNLGVCRPIVVLWGGRGGTVDVGAAGDELGTPGVGVGAVGVGVGESWEEIGGGGRTGGGASDEPRGGDGAAMEPFFSPSRCWRAFPPLLGARCRDSSAGGGSMAADLAPCPSWGFAPGGRWATDGGVADVGGARRMAKGAR